MQTKEMLEKHFHALQEVKKGVREKIQPLKDAREKLVQQQLALQPEIDALTERINAALVEANFIKLSKEISSTAKALGAVSLTEAN